MKGWLRGAVDTVKDATASHPIECPRGWGEVRFHLGLEGFAVFAHATRSCPIGGVESCADCNYPPSPEQIERIRAGLAHLDELRRDGVLTPDEYVDRRVTTIGLHAFRPGRGFRTTAWVLGPLGLVAWIGAVVAHELVEESIWVLPFLVGAVLLALTLSFAMLAARAVRESSRAEAV